jgi:F-type H+-transporting ATPase subunit b
MVRPDPVSRPSRPRAGLAALLLCGWLGLLPGAAQGAVQPHEPAAGAHDAAAAHEEAGGEHGESLWSFLSRIANFAILAGGLYYLLRSPVGGYLAARREQIRRDLETAAQTRAEAAARLVDIEERVRALPHELEALRTRGKDEIAAERVRMKQVAEGERQRLIDQTRREIDRQLRLAKRELTEHAADLAVGVARTRLSRDVTADDHRRLVDRYVVDLGGRRE